MSQRSKLENWEACLDIINHLNLIMMQLLHVDTVSTAILFQRKQAGTEVLSPVGISIW